MKISELFCCCSIDFSAYFRAWAEGLTKLHPSANKLREKCICTVVSQDDVCCFFSKQSDSANTANIGRADEVSKGLTEALEAVNQIKRLIQSTVLSFSILETIF